jgi:hypothetical protein
MRTTLVVTGAAAGVLLGVCLAAGAALGTGAVAWVAAAGTLVVTLVAASRVRPGPQYRQAPRNYGRRAESPRPYPRYHRLTLMLDQALRDRRYFDRVLVPVLRDLALDLADGRPLPPPLAALLDPDRPPETSTTGRPEDRQRLSELLDRLETPEERWI